MVFPEHLRISFTGLIWLSLTTTRPKCRTSDNWGEEDSGFCFLNLGPALLYIFPSVKQVAYKIVFELRSKRLSEKMWTTVSFLQNNNFSLLIERQPLWTWGQSSDLDCNSVTQNFVFICGHKAGTYQGASYLLCCGVFNTSLGQGTLVSEWPAQAWALKYIPPVRRSR